MNPRVTVGVPVRNGERYLAACLESVAHQTYRDIEVVIADNASDDNTPGLARAYCASDARFRYLRQPRNLGLTANFNTLVDEACGTYFKWLAADDELDPTFVERTVEKLEAEPATSLAAAQLRLIDAESAPFMDDGDAYISRDGTTIPKREAIASELADPDPTRRWRTVLRGMLGLQISTYIFGLMRLEPLRRTGRLGAYPGSDKVLLAELALTGTFVEVPEELWGCRIHPDHLGGRSAADVMRAMRPDWHGRSTWQHAHQLAGYLWAIERSDLGPRSRAICLGALSGRLVRDIRR